MLCRPRPLVKESVSGNRNCVSGGKFALGLGLMSAGFCILTSERTLVRRLRTLFNAANGAGTGGDGLCRAVYRPGRHVANYAHWDIPGVTGVLTGIYMLPSGAIANYLAGVIAADQTSQSAFDASGAVNYAINACVDVF